MKIIKVLAIGLLIGFGTIHKASAQATLGEGFGIFVFPSNGQSSEQQDKDEIECYRWARERSGVDPLNMPTVKGEEVDRSPDGSAIRGAARGAAAGAAIGAIAGDAGDGAAIGAVVGGLRGRRSQVVNDERQQQANNRAASNAKADMMDQFRRAFSVCMEGKGYTVK